MRRKTERPPLSAAGVRIITLTVSTRGASAACGRATRLAARAGRPARTAGLGRRTELSAALFTPVQARVLALVFGQPDRRFESAELIRLVEGGTGAVHRQLARLAEAGLVTVTRVGNQKHYQANADSPVYHELHGLVVKTVGLVEPLRLHASRIRAALVYGSVAKGSDRAGSDIDLLILSDSMRHDEVFDAVAPAEAVLGRPVNPTLMSVKHWRAKRSSKGSFVARVAEAPHLFVIGSERDLR